MAQAADTYAELVLRQKARPLWLRLLTGTGTFIYRKPMGAFGSLLVVFFITLAVFAPMIAPYEVGRIDLRNALSGPTGDYWLGTDDVGHDVLTRLIWGARLSVSIGFGSVLASSLVATVLGVFSAYSGGWVDLVIGRVIDAWIALPGLIILITILGIVRRTDMNLTWAMVVALALTRFAPVTRIYRSAVIELRERPYIEAAEASGAGMVRVMRSHVFPNILPLIIVTSTTAVPLAILAEASLSFLGFGPAGEPSWGQMLSVDGREFFRKQPLLALAPGIAISLSVFGFNMFGDALRDVLDPRLRGEGR
ncbi:MAG: ABC transporter permease [Dehalococcoidia bacterium]|jgi:peptide/nickel transport system permease protein|nr:ABC transporter permease [Dehalococcoidia bacterium]